MALGVELQGDDVERDDLKQAAKAPEVLIYTEIINQDLIIRESKPVG
jgi:hypothetical protein